MAFWGILTVILLMLITYKVNKKLLITAGILVAIWYPLVLTSRWAWNPNFVIFWAALGIASLKYKQKLGWISYLITGLSFGAMFHHNYVAIFTTAPFLLLISLPYLMKKKFKPVLLMFLGYVLPYLLFVLFDLKNPPGLFFGQYLFSGNTPHVQKELTLQIVAGNLFRNLKVYLATFVDNSFMQVLFLISLVSLILRELKTKTYQTITWVLPSVFVIIAGVMLSDFQTRYVFSSVAFLFVWLLIPRKNNINKILVKVILFILIIGSLFSIKPQLTIADTPPNMRVFTRASNIIMDTIKAKNLKNYNVAALSSHDPAPLAEKYRYYFSTHGMTAQADSQYGISEHLFVVTTATNQELRQDQSYAMIAFEDKELKDIFPVGEGEWKVIWYGIDVQN